jgi:hypothetical protein
MSDDLDVSDVDSVGSTIVMDVSREESVSPGDLVIDENLSAEAAEGN